MESVEISIAVACPDRGGQYGAKGKREMGNLNKHVKAFTETHCLDGEEIVSWVPAQRDKEGFEGVLILTDRRVAFLRKGMLSDKFEPWPVDRISSVESKRGLVWYSIKLHTSGDDLELRSTDKAKAAQWVSLLQMRLSGNSSRATTETRGSEGDVMATLTKLGELKASGVLTEEEFQTKKVELLAKI